MTGNVVPTRIKEAREIRAMSMEDLAEKVNVTRQSISKFEHGIISPSLETLQAISLKLDFPLEFFYKTELAPVAEASPLIFRSNSNIRQKVKTACAHQVKWTREIKSQLETYVDFVEQDLPVIERNYEDFTMNDVENLALSIREEWNLAGDPVGDLIGLLENRGVIVAQIAANNFCSFKGIDAFSCWEDGTPYILYNPNQKSAVRIRFSILHELGHLIMHSSISPEDARKNADFADSQADRFAASFLLPAITFPKDVHGSSLARLELVKKKWGASMSAIIRRCKTLEILSESQIDYLSRQMTMKKYWHKEPLDEILTIEGPEMLRDAIYLLIENKIVTKASFIRNAGIPINDLKYICSLPDEFFEDVVQRRKPLLRVVES